VATAYQNLSDYDFDSVPDAKGMKFGIVVSEWNKDVTERLLNGACDTLERHGVEADDIYVRRVPGSFELTYGSRLMTEHLDVNAVIALGCVVRGETPHFDFVCSAVTQGITKLNLTAKIPVVFGLLTTDTMKQAEARAGGNYGNKGDEAAVTAIKMAALRLEFSK
jgi:6,7-dimethyl-8-ribityllumazine synthase